MFYKGHQFIPYQLLMIVLLLLNKNPNQRLPADQTLTPPAEQSIYCAEVSTEGMKAFTKCLCGLILFLSIQFVFTVVLNDQTKPQYWRYAGNVYSRKTPSKYRAVLSTNIWPQFADWFATSWRKLKSVFLASNKFGTKTTIRVGSRYINGYSIK